MNFFEQELRKVCALSEYIENPKFVGKTAVFKLSDEITGKLEFVTEGHADHYTALRMTLINRTEGQIDVQNVTLTDLLGHKQFRSGNTFNPYIWRDEDDVDWYGFTPTKGDYTAMAQTADDYLSCFADQEMTEDLDFELK